MISYFIIGLGTVPHIPIIISILLLVTYGLVTRIPFKDLGGGMIAGATAGMGAIWFNGYKATTNFEPVNELLTKGGINSMLFTISLVILSLGFGGLLFITGIVPSLLMALQEKLKKVRSIIMATAATAIGVNVLIGEQYLSILLTGETFKTVYQKFNLPNKVLSRTLEDAGTVINPLVPWSVCEVFIADVLGVPVLTYLPFAFFCLLSPVITVIFSGKRTSKI